MKKRKKVTLPSVSSHPIQCSEILKYGHRLSRHLVLPKHLREVNLFLPLYETLVVVTKKGYIKNTEHSCFFYPNSIHNSSCIIIKDFFEKKACNSKLQILKKIALHLEHRVNITSFCCHGIYRFFYGSMSLFQQVYMIMMDIPCC